jgi:hypothetical protein
MTDVILRLSSRDTSWIALLFLTYGGVAEFFLRL